MNLYATLLHRQEHAERRRTRDTTSQNFEGLRDYANSTATIKAATKANTAKAAESKQAE